VVPLVNSEKKLVPRAFSEMEQLSRTGAWRATAGFSATIY